MPILFIPVITGLSVHHICENHFFVRFANGDDGKRTDKCVQCHELGEEVLKRVKKEK